jgi:predicted MFS family arabinose efflux permease
VIRAATFGWADPVTVLAFGAAAVLLVVFTMTEARADQPVMPLRLFADRRRVAAYVNTLLVPSTILAVIYFLGQYLQESFGYGPLRSGLAFLPMTMALMGAVRIVSNLIRRWGTRPVMAVGIAFITTALLWLTTLSSASGYWSTVFGPLVVLGVGAGLATVTLSVTALSGVRRADSGAGAGLFQTLQWSSWSLGLAALVTVYHAGATGRPNKVDALAHGTTAAFAGATVLAALALLNTLLFVRDAIQPQAVKAEPMPTTAAVE